MKRYQKLILNEVDRLYELAEQERGDRLGPGVQPDRRNKGYADLSRSLGAPSTSVHEWGTYPHKVPTYKSLVKIAEYFNVPLPTLLMEADDPKLFIVDALFKADLKQINAVASMLDIKPCP